MLKFLKPTFWAIALAATVLFLHYNLPRTEVVRITGTEVKRLDRNDPGRVTRTRDVRFLSTVTRDGKVKVFRNEDTGWGWPPYLKFDSADMSAEAQAYHESSQKPWVLVRYYGWRIRIFSLFPNAISLKIVSKDYTHVPWFNIIFIALLATGMIFGVLAVRRLMKRLGENEHFQVVRGAFENLGKRFRRE